MAYILEFWIPGSSFQKKTSCFWKNFRHNNVICWQFSFVNLWPLMEVLRPGTQGLTKSPSFPGAKQQDLATTLWNSDRMQTNFIKNLEFGIPPSSLFARLQTNVAKSRVLYPTFQKISEQLCVFSCLLGSMVRVFAALDWRSCYHLQAWSRQFGLPPTLQTNIIFFWLLDFRARWV